MTLGIVITLALVSVGSHVRNVVRRHRRSQLCGFCEEPIVDHTPSERRSCLADLRIGGDA